MSNFNCIEARTTTGTSLRPYNCYNNLVKKQVADLLVTLESVGGRIMVAFVCGGCGVSGACGESGANEERVCVSANQVFVVIFL